MDITNTIEMYHELGSSQDEILCFLATFDKVIISKKSLKRVLKKGKLFRRKNYLDDLDVALYLSQKWKILECSLCMSLLFLDYSTNLT